MSPPTDPMSYATLLHRIHKGLSTIELIHTSHSRWPLPPHPASTLAPSLHISVLDSSFNPPTLAHLALANTLPPPTTDVPPSKRSHDFDARLLLLSVRNADKQLKPGDATYEQRTEMMVLLAHELARAHARDVPAAQAQVGTPTSDSAEPEQKHEPNVAVAIIDEPTFVGKSTILHTFLCARIASLLSPATSPGVSIPSSPPAPAPKLTFLMGTDTVARLFAPRYYASEPDMRVALRRFLSPAPEGEDSRLVCARRVSTGATRADEEAIEVEMAAFARTIVPYERLACVDIGEREATFSSSEVRVLRAHGDERWRDMVAPSIVEYISQHNLYLAS
ncbi:Nucleotidylyl transferase [Lenzites betulinus]|nr:Nucleotidylyl transferase [Lenzites betulinus]